MNTLKGKRIYLRALEPEDLGFLYQVENDEAIWELSHTQAPYSQFVLKQYLSNAHQDIFEAKQLRLVISDYNGKALGMIDLFDFDFKNRRAGVGILVYEPNQRQQGFGREALELLIQYSFNHLNLHQLYCNIAEDNTDSVKLFENQGFKMVGVKKDWIYSNKNFKNECLFQLIND